MISTKDIEIKGSGDLISKIIEPGNLECTIRNIELAVPPYDSSAYNIVLECEGPDMGEGFEGFFIDPENESKGRYAGQLGIIKANRWYYKDGETKRGRSINRDIEILRHLKVLCTEIGTEGLDWFDSINDKYETIEEIIEAFNKTTLFQNLWFKYCVAGKEYAKPDNYIGYDLFLPNAKRGFVAFEKTGNTQSKLMSFNRIEHWEEYVPSVEDSAGIPKDGDQYPDFPPEAEIAMDDDFEV